MMARDSTVLSAALSADQKWRMNAEVDEVLPFLLQAIVEKEDKWFYYHPGINPVAVLRATANNMWSGQRTSGASTITMQVARLLQPAPRTYWNKLLEMLRAIKLELCYGKREILELYINLIPYGGNLEGVKAASLLYFGCLPSRLSPAQAITLAIIPNRPTSLGFGSDNTFLLQQRNRWIQRFQQSGVLPATQAADALNEPLNAWRRPIPAIAPHLARRLFAAYPDKNNILTLIDARIQQAALLLARNYLRRWQINGVYNASVLIIDNQKRSILAYIGNPEFNDKMHQGQVDGIKAIRSPGSALKPFLYGMAIDKGILTPNTILYDVPINFQGYMPENFHKLCSGPISMENALAASLNIPTVSTLAAIGINTFTDALAAAGCAQIAREKKNLGLSTALGGCGIRLEEIAGLYCALAMNGIWKPLCKISADTLQQQTVSLLSPESAWMIREILTTITRPDLPQSAANNYRIPRIAWKTGTSYGRRDAWSIGITPRYTIAVWVGNFTGMGMPALSGAEAATPLLFELFNTLEYATQNNWFSKPAHLDYRLVCAETGLIPGTEYCTSQIVDAYIPGISSMRHCKHRKQVDISADQAFSYCMTCRPENGYKRRDYPNYPPELILFYEQEHRNYEKIPPHNPACTRVFGGNGPMIQSPVDNKTYILEKEDGQVSRLMLQAQGEPDVQRFSWYINDRLLKIESALVPVFYAPEQSGPLRITCADDKGRATSIMIQAEIGN
jgi:penicillin-binding protein 1C